MRSASPLWPTFLAYTVSLWISDVYASRLTSRSFAFITPHAEYSSSVGVLGCKVDTNRVAYWPLDVGCDGICVRVSNEGRSLHLLHIDKSGGAVLGNSLQIESRVKNVAYGTGEIVPV
ncbi:hypothetical protein FOC4_h10017047, partial [Fusarium odoratissimum]|uniref:Uncharacterized protein n=2 Tax=Fusarium oxysporum species complex TaxID=171631 RepID=A0A5C6SHQ8_FUSOC